MAITRAELPLVSVVVAFYRESEATFQRCAAGLRALDYPPARLEVIWVIERGEAVALGRARNAIGSGASVASWRVVEAQPISPRAAAINAGLAAATGEILGLLDADAVPEPSQLRKAVAALETGRWDAVESPQFAELGARRWVAGLIRAEEAAWFASMQWMDRLTGTHMLAGSSIYFPRLTFERVGVFVGPWGEEPIDWSLRFADLGLRAGVLDSISRCMPFRNAWAGLLQRRRWFKGQTECLIRMTSSLSAGRARSLALIVLASNLAVLFVLPALLASALSRVAAALFASLAALEALRIAVTVVACRDLRAHVPKRGWLLLLPWELATSLGYWLGLFDWLTGRKVWDQARE